MENDQSKIYFIGIGGIGVSALARYYLGEGWQVYGTDLAESEITESLKKAGAEFYKKAPDLGTIKPDLLVYSPAVGNGHPELKQARDLGIECLSYPEALGKLSDKYFTIAVCGTHGKSTTTAMIAGVLVAAGFDPTVVVGTKLKEFDNTNFRRGRSQYLVIEACEHLGSFLNYWPKVIVLTNIEADHLDYYQNEDNYRRAFYEFVNHLDGSGILVANSDDKNTRELVKQVEAKGFKIVDFKFEGPETKKLEAVLQVPGKHNIYNALAALFAAHTLGIGEDISLKALGRYQGAWRRFEIDEISIENKRVTLVSDYGHHPTEVRATLEAARQRWPERKITAIFQPHQYQRTFYLFDDFAKVLREAPVDRIIVADIYGVAGREEKGLNEKVSSHSLAEAAGKKSVFYVERPALSDWILKNIEADEVLVIMGAGDIYGLSESLIKKNV